MSIDNLFTIIAKILVFVLLLLYLLYVVNLSRQVFLMNRAIKTKLAGCLNCGSFILVVLVILLIFLLIIV